MTAIMDKYVSQNLEQQISETDLFTLERYAQFNRFLPVGASRFSTLARTRVEAVSG